MWRSNQQVQAANRAGRPFVDLVVERDGEVWRFWAMAPAKASGADCVWLTDGVRFKVAGVDRSSGAVFWLRVWPLAVEELAASRVGFSERARLADDVVTETALFGSAKSPGCPCSGCASVAVRKAALARFATVTVAA